MSRLWLAAASNAALSEDDFKRVALSLVCGQVLYFANPQQRTAYQLVRAHRQAFEEVLEHLGLRLGVDDMYRMVFVVPEIDLDRPVPQDESLLALVLRQIHDEKSSRGESEAGTVTVSIGDLYSTYQRLTGRELPKRGEGKERQALFDALRRYGIMREEPDPESESGPNIRILPGITALLSLDTIARLRPVDDSAAIRESSKTEDLEA